MVTFEMKRTTFFRHCSVFHESHINFPAQKIAILRMLYSYFFIVIRNGKTVPYDYDFSRKMERIKSGVNKRKKISRDNNILNFF